jgi:glutamine phosphoribosylpyrophosphate amidotransferase
MGWMSRASYSIAGRRDPILFPDFYGIDISKTTDMSQDVFCTGCFTGEYPIDIKERAREFTERKVCYTPFAA